MLGDLAHGIIQFAVLITGRDLGMFSVDIGFEGHNSGV